MKVKKIVAIIIVLAMVVSIIGLAGCGRTFTEEEHIERITARLQARYFYDDGTPTNNAIFRRSYGEELLDGGRAWMYFTLERFEVQILSAFDGVREYFMVQYFPVEIGYRVGIKLGSEYRIFDLYRDIGINPFEKLKLDISNRYFIFMYLSGSHPTEALAKRNEQGEFVSLAPYLMITESYYVWTQERIDRQLQFNRSSRGRRIIRRVSTRI